MGYTVINTADEKEEQSIYAWVQPVGWSDGGHKIIQGNSFDQEYFGDDVLRIKTGRPVIESLAVKIKVNKTVVRKDFWGNPVHRCMIEFLGDGEPSTFSKGFIAFDLKVIDDMWAK